MKTLQLPAGRYIVAVSGGVDSVVLLDILRQQSDLELIIAHFDHGIRSDSKQDRLLVEQLAKRYGLTFRYKEAKLGPHTSEDTARQARYAFLRSVMRERQAAAIVTAHHLDDSIETAIINLLRGTNRRGLSSLRSTVTIKRPLLNSSKAELLDYAKNHNLSWREDITNSDEIFLRNKIRNQLKNASGSDKQKFLSIIQSEAKLNDNIDIIIAELIKQNSKSDHLSRQWFANLPYVISKEILACWLVQSGISNISRKRIDQLTTNLKTAMPGKQLEVNNKAMITIKKYYLALESRDR